MKTNKTVIVSVVSVLWVLSQWTSAAPICTASNNTFTIDNRATISISGRVEDAYSGTAISEAIVVIAGYPSTLTDANGNYTITGVVPGVYLISASASGYNSFGVTMSAPSKADMSQLDNPARSKANHQTGTELCV